MKAIVKKTSARGLWLEEVPTPEIGMNDVLIRVLRTSICGTDVHIYEWDAWAQRTIRPPLIIGHECVGVVQEVGWNVLDFKPGDLVSGEGHIVCGHCRNCLAGRRHLCMATRGIGINRSGAFAEYISLPVTNVWPCDRGISLEVLSCFDPLGNAVHTVLSFDVLGEDVLITGAGPIGLMAVAVAKKAGARHVVITERNPHRLKLAQRMEPTRIVDTRCEALGDVMGELHMREGFDVGLEMSGSPQALNDLVGVMCHGGKIAVLGIVPNDTGIDWEKVVFNGLTIKGIYGREMYETWYKTTALVQSGLDITPVITDRLEYYDFQEGFELVRSGRSGKVILKWAELSGLT